LGLTVGSAENKLISMVSYAKTANEKSILVLDDIENLIGVDYEGPAKGGMVPSTSSGNRTSNGEPHLISRLRSLLFSLLDILRQCDSGGQMLLLCTSKTDIGKFTDRFDVTCSLGLPNPQQRKQVLLQHAMLWVPSEDCSIESHDPIIDGMLSNLVECTSGFSFAELSQYCRQAIATKLGNVQTNVSGHDNSLRPFCEAMKQQLQTSMPESLRTGMNADFVDMTVWTARDLSALSKSVASKEGSALPLFGNSAAQAWEELRRSIVMPVCQAKALSQLLFDGKASPGGRVLAGGVLLTGPPGTGKSALAYHCAAVASAINPSVKLIDVSCTSLIRKEVGSSERAIHRLFKVAKAAAPCIVLMDGIENVAAVRGHDNTTEGTMDRVLSTLLTSLDGVDTAPTSTDEPATLAIIGITHNVNWIDPALRRPGRLDRILELGLPEKDARQQIIVKHLTVTEFESADPEFPTLDSIAAHVAAQIEGSTGAEVIALCDGAKMLASKEWFEGTQSTSPALRPEHVVAAMKLRNS
jgi:SpoVK/Ycf46/Vps4 family AAA+-type ATPase